MIPALPHTPAVELAGDLRSVVNRLAYLLRTPASREGITPTKLTAMATLSHLGPLRQGDLAARLGITAASMSRLAEALEEGRWVNRTPDPEDGRACDLSLTAHGVEALEDLRRENTSDLADTIGALTDEQRAALDAALPVLTSLADSHRDGRARA